MGQLFREYPELEGAKWTFVFGGGISAVTGVVDSQNGRWVETTREDAASAADGAREFINLDRVAYIRDSYAG